jgi:hypothetical protein
VDLIVNDNQQSAQQVIGILGLAKIIRRRCFIDEFKQVLELGKSRTARENRLKPGGTSWLASRSMSRRLQTARLKTTISEAGLAISS